MRFLLYDKILQIEPGQHAHGRKMVALADEYFPEHYPRRAVMPATLLIEAMAQVAGWLNVVSRGFMIGTVLGLIDGVRIYRQVYPGDALDIEVQMLFSHPDGATLRGEIRTGGELVATAERLIFANHKVQDENYAVRERKRFAYLGGVFQAEGEN